MNHILFSGKLLADAKVVKGDKGNFISFTLVESGKGENLPILEVTQNFKGNEPTLFSYLKKFAKVIVTGTPYAKAGRNREKENVPVLAAFADRIEIVEFAPKREE